MNNPAPASVLEQAILEIFRNLDLTAPSLTDTEKAEIRESFPTDEQSL